MEVSRIVTRILRAAFSFSHHCIIVMNALLAFCLLFRCEVVLELKVFGLQVDPAESTEQSAELHDRADAFQDAHVSKADLLLQPRYDISTASTDIRADEP